MMLINRGGLMINTSLPCDNKNHLTTKTEHMIKKSNTGLFIKDIDRIDSAIWEIGRGIVGQSWHVDVCIEGGLDENRFIYDFSDLKNLIKKTLKSTLDHVLLIPTNDPAIRLSENEHSFSIDDNLSDISYQGPKKSVYFIKSKMVSEALIESELNNILKPLLPSSVSDVRFKIHREINEGGHFFHYTHGITGHKGNCQRLFHGHRSLIEVLVNSKQRSDLEKIISEKLLKSSIHIAERSQISESTKDKLFLQYTANEGIFRCSIPKNQVVIIEEGTSIETLVEFFASNLEGLLVEGDTLEVRAYEGIGKGAIATRQRINEKDHPKCQSIQP